MTCTGFTISVQQEEIQARIEVIASMMKEIASEIQFMYEPDIPPEISLSKCTLVIGQVTLEKVMPYPFFDVCGNAPDFTLPAETDSNQCMGMFLPAPATKNHPKRIVSKRDAKKAAEERSSFIDLKKVGMVFLFCVEKNPSNQNTLRCVSVAQDLKRSVRYYSLQVSALVQEVYKQVNLKPLDLGAVTFIWNQKLKQTKKKGSRKGKNLNNK